MPDLGTAPARPVVDGLAQRLAITWAEHRAGTRFERIDRPGRRSLVMTVQHRAVRTIKSIEILDGTGPTGGFDLYEVNGVIPDGADWRRDLEADAPWLRRLEMRAQAILDGIEAKLHPFAQRSAEIFFDSMREEFGASVLSRIPLPRLAEQEMVRVREAGFDSALEGLHRGALRIATRAALAQPANTPLSQRLYRYYAQEGDAGRDRLQAAEQWPLLAPLMEESPTVRGAVAERTPLADALVSVLALGDPEREKVVKPVLSRLRGITGTPLSLSSRAMVSALCEIPPDWLRKEPEEWEAMIDVIDGALMPLSTLSGNTLGALANASQGKWTTFADRLANAAVNKRPPVGTTKETYPWLQAQVTDAKALGERMGPDAAASALVKRMEENGLPEVIQANDVHAWIIATFFADSGRTALRRYVADVDDMVEGFFHRLFMPLVMRATGYDHADVSPGHYEMARRASGKFLFNGVNAVTILEMNRIFHGRINELLYGGAGNDVDAEKARQDEQTRKLAEEQAKQDRYFAILRALEVVHATPEWPPLTPPVQAPNGIWFVPLCAQSLLVLEGTAMDHCVGWNHYDQRCMELGRHVIGVREIVNGKMKRLSTMELAKLPLDLSKVNEAHVLQNYGFRPKVHDRPPHAVAEATSWYINGIATGQIPVNVEKMMAHQAMVVTMMQAQAVDPVERMAGFAWTRKDLVQGVLEVWTPLLPKRFRGLDVDVAALDPAILAVAQEINPALRPAGVRPTSSGRTLLKLRRPHLV